MGGGVRFLFAPLFRICYEQTTNKKLEGKEAN